MENMQYSYIKHGNERMEFIINRSREADNLPLVITEMGHSFPPRGKTADSVTSCWQLHFVLSGEGLFRQEKLSCGTGFLVMPGEAQNMRVVSDGFEQYWINFYGSDVKNIFYRCGIPAHSHVFDFASDSAKKELTVSLLKSIFSSEESSHNSNLRHTHTYLTGLLYQLLGTNSREVKNNISTRERYASTVCSYIRSHYPEALTIEWLSAIVGLSPKYLIRIFKAVTGCTLVEYITEIRLENACSLLEGTDKSVGEIAECVGYSDALYFSKVFAAKYNIPPTSWRKMHTKV